VGKGWGIPHKFGSNVTQKKITISSLKGRMADERAILKKKQQKKELKQF